MLARIHKIRVPETAPSIAQQLTQNLCSDLENEYKRRRENGEMGSLTERADLLRNV